MPERPSLTPLEQAAYFAQTVPGVSEDVHHLARLYAQDLYSPHILQQDELNLAKFTWLKLRSRFIRVWLGERLRFIQRLQFWRS